MHNNQDYSVKGEGTSEQNVRRHLFLGFGSTGMVPESECLVTFPTAFCRCNIIQFIHLKCPFRPGELVQACNPCYSEDCSSRPVLAKSSKDLISTND
jgi:hypothetical protein